VAERINALTMARVQTPVELPALPGMDQMWAFRQYATFA